MICKVKSLAIQIRRLQDKITECDLRLLLSSIAVSRCEVNVYIGIRKQFLELDA